MDSIKERNDKRGFTVATLRAKAARYGATVEGEVVGKQATYNIESPKGKVWSASSTHALNVNWRTNEEGYRNEAIVDALERMELGLADCDSNECDYCESYYEEDENGYITGTINGINAGDKVEVISGESYIGSEGIVDFLIRMESNAVWARVSGPFSHRHVGGGSRGDFRAFKLSDLKKK